MNVNQKIENALSSLVNGNIWPVSCPLETLPDKWITYVPELEKPEDFGDDEDLEWMHYMQVHWFAESGSNYMGVRKEIRKRLKEAGFSVTDITYLYEKNTKMTHKKITHLVFSCNIPEEEPYGET